jgi:2-haloacid dehalogenase
MIGIYKTRPESYGTAAKWLALDPPEIMMVACHNFDLDAARACGYQTAFVRRPDEWGTAGPPDPQPNPACTIVVDGFAALADKLLGIQGEMHESV